MKRISCFIVLTPLLIIGEHSLVFDFLTSNDSSAEKPLFDAGAFLSPSGEEQIFDKLLSGVIHTGNSGDTLPVADEHSSLTVQEFQSADGKQDVAFPVVKSAGYQDVILNSIHAIIFIVPEQVAILVVFLSGMFLWGYRKFFNTL